MTDDEEIKAQKQYQKQVKTFRSALDSGKRLFAQDLADEYDWSVDMLADELNDWFWS